MERYGAAALGLTAAEQERFARAMAAPAPAWIASGGGAQALVFTGCAEAGCGAGRAVLAIDTATGAAFMGVRDEGGAVELVVNDRVEALLRLASPTRNWHDPAPQELRNGDPAREAAQP
jgi:hypothetical protein